MDKATEGWLEKLGLSEASVTPEASSLTFDDGGRYQLEIPEVENGAVFREVVKVAKKRGVPVHRVSQGTGITRLSNSEMSEIARIGSGEAIEVYLFLGVRGENGLGYQSRSPGGGSSAKRLQGSRQLSFALGDVHRALDAGIRGFLVSDEGLLWCLGQLRNQGVIPPEVALKTSVSMGHGNAASAMLIEKLGADSFNLPVDLDVGSLADIRHAIQIPVDQYIEAPALLGGGQRYHELADIVTSCAPVNLKFGLATETLTDPVGLHTEPTALVQARERVRLAALGVEFLRGAGLLDAMADPNRPRHGIPAEC